MITNKVAFRYAQGLLELAEEAEIIDIILADFKELKQMVAENEDLSGALYHPQLSKKKKKELVSQLFSEQINQQLLNFLKLLFDKNRITHLDDIYSEFKQLVDAKRGQASLVVEVQAPIELDNEQSEKLSTKLESLLDKKVEMKVSIKPELLGGLIVKVGDKIVDGSILRQLKRLEEDIKSLEVSKLGVKWNES